MMTDTMRLSLLLICVFVYGRNGLGSAFPTEVTPNKVRAVAPLAANMTCIPSKPMGPGETVLIEARLQDDLANVRLRYSPEALRTGTDAGTEFFVEGHVNNEDGTKSYLTLAVMNPKPEDAGKYQCAVYRLGGGAGSQRQRRSGGGWSIKITVTVKF